MGVLNKKPSWLTVPDHVNYEKRAMKDLWLLVGILAAVGCIFCLASCSTSYKVRKSYEKAASYSPLTSKDSANAFLIAKKVIKEKPPKVIPGKTIIKKVPIKTIVKQLDTALISHISDSLLQSSISQTENYNDNIDELIRDCDKAVRKAIKEGYRQALDSVGNIQLPNDTIPIDEETLMELQDCQLSLRIAQADLIATQAKHATYKLLFWVLLAAVLFGLSLGVLIKRTKVSI